MSHDARPKNETRARLFALALFAAAGLAAYSNVLDAFFLSDDFAQIGKVLRGDLSVTWGREHGGFFRPLFILSNALDAALWGRRPLGFHLTNVLLHSLNAFLVFLLAPRLAGRVDEPARLHGPAPATPGDASKTPSNASESGAARRSNASESGRGRRRLAYTAAFIFLLHPSHTEAVSWVSGRADLLSTFFCLLALLAFVARARTGRAAPLLFALVAFALALLSKEAALCFPLLAALAGIRLGRDSDAPAAHASTTPERPSRAPAGPIRRALLSALPFLCVLALYVAARALALGTLVGGYGSARHLYLTHGVVASQLLRAALRVVFPAVALRSLPFLESRALSPTLILTGALLLVVSAVVLRRAESRRRLARFLRRHAPAWLLVALAVAAFLPALNLRLNVYDTQGERFLYLPSVFFSLLAARALAGGARGSSGLRAAALVSLLLLYAVGLWRTNLIWREASGLSRQLVADVVAQSTREQVLVLNAPDNLRGAYVFRNGFEQALRTFQDAKPYARVGVAAVHDTDSRADAVEFEAEGGGVVSLTLTNPKASFAPAAGQGACARVVENTGRTLRLRLEPCAADYDLFFFSAGRMRKAGGP